MIIKRALQFIAIIFSAACLFLQAGCGGGESGTCDSIVRPLITEGPDEAALKELAENLDADVVRSAIPDKSWVAGDTEISDHLRRSPNFAGGEFLGLAADGGALSPADGTVRQFSPSISASDLPAYFSWRNYRGMNCVTPVKNQGPYPTCVSFAATAALETAYKLKTGLDHDFSELYLFHFGGGNYRFGWNYAPALARLEKDGTVLEEACPYRTIRSPLTADQFRDAVKYKISYRTQIYNVRDNIKTALLKAPVMSSIVTYYDLSYYKSGIYSPVKQFTIRGKTVENAPRGGHAILITGYNDAEGYYECKNSWGTAWGENGYFRLKYGASSLGYAGSYILSTEDQPQIIVNPPSALSYSKAGGGRITVKWTASGASNYCVYVNNKLAGTTTETSYTISVSEDIYYYIFVNAVKGSKSSAPSPVLTVFIPSVLTPPSGLSYSPAPAGCAVRLTWNSTGADKYNIYVNGVLHISTCWTEYTLNIKENTEYSITVTSVKNSKESAHSAVLKVHAKNSENDPFNPPRALSYSIDEYFAANIKIVCIQWNSTGAEKYNIYIDGKLAFTTASRAYYLIYTKGREYKIEVTSVNASRESRRSEPLMIKCI